MRFWRRYAQNRAAVVGLGFVGFFATISVLAPLIFPGDPFAFGPETFNSPSLEHFSLMGTDDLGRSILGELLYGGRMSLLVGLASALSAVGIGIAFGLLAGYFAGFFGEAIMRVSEIFQVVPRFFLALILVAVLGPSIYNIVLAIAITSWPVLTRIVRAETLSVREKEFVEASRAIGETNVYIMFSEVLPNVLPPVIVNASLLVGQAILTEASLSFLGLGDPSAATWGYMLYNAQPFLRYAWWMATFPGLAITLVVLGLNLIGDGLNDALNPRLRQL